MSGKTMTSMTTTGGLDPRVKEFADLVVLGVPPGMAFARAGCAEISRHGVASAMPRAGALVTGIEGGGTAAADVGKPVTAKKSARKRAQGATGSEAAAVEFRDEGSASGAGADRSPCGDSFFVRHGFPPVPEDVELEMDLAAARLMRVPVVRDYIRAERRTASEAGRWEKWQLLDMLQAILETPVGAVDEMSPLAEEMTADRVGSVRAVKKVAAAKKAAAGKFPAKGKLGTVERVVDASSPGGTAAGGTAAGGAMAADGVGSPALASAAAGNADTTSTDDDAVTTIRTKVKMFGKKDAAVMLAQLMGWKAPVKEEASDGMDEFAKFMRELRANRF